MKYECKTCEGRRYILDESSSQLVYISLSRMSIGIMAHIVLAFSAHKLTLVSPIHSWQFTINNSELQSLDQ